MLAIKCGRHVIDDGIVPVLAAEPVIASSRAHIEVLALHTHDRDVERSADEVEYEHGLILVQFIETISERGGSRLVDDLQDIEAGELAGGDGGGSFRVVEIRRNRDNRVGNRLLEIFLCVELDLL